MRVAMLAPITWRTPPRTYGPWELVTSMLTEALVARGIDVTLFATLDSITSGKLDGVVPAPYGDDASIDAKVWEFRHLAYLFEQDGQFDLIHNQADFPAHAFARLTNTPIVTTIHGFSSERILPMYAAYQDVVHYVAIVTPIVIPVCATLRRSITAFLSTIFRSIRPAATICSSLDASMATKGLLRRSPPRGTSGRRLQMYGIVQDTEYSEREVLPAVDGERVIYHGAVGGTQRRPALGEARAVCT